MIKVVKESSKITTQLAKKLGGNVHNPDEDQYEDITLGYLMNMEKTGKTVVREDIMTYLKKKK